MENYWYFSRTISSHILLNLYSTLLGMKEASLKGSVVHKLGRDKVQHFGEHMSAGLK